MAVSQSAVSSYTLCIFVTSSIIVGVERGKENFLENDFLLASLRSKLLWTSDTASHNNYYYINACI